MERAVEHWHRLPRAGMGSPSLEGIKNPGAVALGDGVWVVLGGCVDLMISEVFSNLNDSLGSAGRDSQALAGQQRGQPRVALGGPQDLLCPQGKDPPLRDVPGCTHRGSRVCRGTPQLQPGSC